MSDTNVLIVYANSKNDKSPVKKAVIKSITDDRLMSPMSPMIF
jgi:hypothetical protein